MKLPKIVLVLFGLLTIVSCSSDNDSPNDSDPQNGTIYFPPLNSDNWETKSISELDWNETELQPLLDYLENKNTKSFMVLHEGKIVIEAYFNGHSSTSPWYWASAGKTLTTALTGIAESEGYISIEDKVSDYIGTGWTSANIDKENLITCKHLLSMTSGLDDSEGDGVEPGDLQYIADADTRWAYHNVYVKLQDVVSQATNQSWDDYLETKILNPTGMSGSYFNVDDFNVFWSNTRTMARFGLLNYANGIWENNQIIPENYLNDAVNTSQNINLAYGYLWWLNGKSSYHLPQSQFEFPGKLIPNAPNDMYAALGKNDQKIYVIPSKKLVVIRMGQAADDENFALSGFDNELWEKINALIN
ncbi:serine hydrolase domain-containing protein [Winogradskyella marincola]|uniref:Serine hydrolase n=1 Tax=Winogradskyella marincola TaxID=3037795 RepID=A0ABT6FX71_9FLAO|nr:serine hydrolase [Winogradskyella sp. YYF002]MDG4714382.1 serine hydrolase [Winogradskyella sp. YYF002]